ncbi:HMG box protein [Coniochaeta sp. 2T2.1]|nr:HMG box protein [Coniochaeta sp. 2T2.1]
MSSSTRSGPASAGRQTLPDKKPERTAGEPPSPDSPLRSAGPLTRKRAASLRTDGPRIEDLSLNTPTATERSPPQLPESGRDLICLCTPAPKVPRPRNAFILYRQHHQAQVVAQNPGLANPEISKIIGERWREESDEHKEQWKRLAEEEKVRHQRQYPDYRYQPRRGGKTAASRAATPNPQPGEDPGRCPKCGGRYIATPRTPSTPFPYTNTHSRGTMPTANSGSMSYAPNPRAVESDHARHASQSHGREPPQHRGSYQNYAPQPQHHHHQYQPRSNLHGISEDYDMESPSAVKRRRYDSSGGSSDGPSYSVSHGPQYSYGGQPYPHTLPHHVRPPPPPQQQPVHRHPSVGGHGMPSPAYPPPGNSLPGPSQLGPRGSIGMAPPPRPPPSATYPPSGPPRRETGTGTPSAPGFDESLRLPPLQTPTTTTHVPAPPAPARHSLSPTSVGTAGPIPQTQQRDRDSQARGVEAMIMSIPYINKLKVLEKIAPPLAPGSPGNETRGPVIAVEGAVPSLVRQVGAIVERALAASGECAVRTWSSDNGKTEGVEGGQLGFATYLRTITDWHGKSAEIVKHITTSPEPARRGSDVSMDGGSGDERKSNPGSVSGEATRASSVNTAVSAPQPQGAQQQRPLLPVALLTEGFSLTISDRFACKVPIADSYAPVDHWQWMATLWRGIVGPDLVIYVRGAEEEEMTRLQAVEMNGADIMKVRVVVPTGAAANMNDVVVGEKVERRLGFEVVEWVRNGSFKEG